LRVLRLDVGVDVVELARPPTSEIEVSEQALPVLAIIAAELPVETPSVRAVAAHGVDVELVLARVLAETLRAPFALANEVENRVDVLVRITHVARARRRS
jgi:glucose/arabinose dehydrogenase